MSVEAVVDRGLRVTPAPFFHRRARNRLTVLAYHAVDDVARFRSHLQILRELACPISLQELIDSAGDEGSLPEHAVLVTFDDNHRSILDVALPALAELKIPAVAFVIAGCLIDRTRPWFADLDDPDFGDRATRYAGLSGTDLKRALKRVSDPERLATLEALKAGSFQLDHADDQLRPEDLSNLTEAGIEIGNHTLTHPCLPQCSTAKIEHEIVEAHRVITSMLGTAPRAIAYPNGDCDERVVAIAKKAGYEAGFLFDHRLNSLPVHEHLRISRVRVNSAASDDRFVNLISGLHPAIHRIRVGITHRFHKSSARLERK